MQIAALPTWITLIGAPLLTNLLVDRILTTRLPKLVPFTRARWAISTFPLFGPRLTFLKGEGWQLSAPPSDRWLMAPECTNYYAMLTTFNREIFKATNLVLELSDAKVEQTVHRMYIVDLTFVTSTLGTRKILTVKSTNLFMTSVTTTSALTATRTHQGPPSPWTLAPWTLRAR